jgi:8-oxo-dGTP diphosphatase
VVEKRGVGILIIKDGKVLLGKRCEGWANGTWTMPGGKLDSSEDPEQGAIREVIEETGMKIEDLETISVNQDSIDGKTYTTFIFKPNKILGKPIVKEPDQIEKWEWFDFNNLPKNLYVPSKKAINQFLKNLKK